MIKVQGALRCAYCHGAAQGLLECCDGCGVLVHADCRRELGRCSTLGCAAPSAQGVSISSPPRHVLIRGATIERWFRRLAPTAAILACVGGCLLFSGTRVPSKRHHHRWQMHRAMLIKAASANYHADHRRYPTSVAELLAPSKQGPYLLDSDSPPIGIERFRFVTHGRVVWIALELDSEDNPYETETIRLLEVLYEHEPSANWAPLSSSARSQRPY